MRSILFIHGGGDNAYQFDLDGLTPDSTVVAHSIGAAAALKVLSRSKNFPVQNLFLLAPPFKAADSHWGNDGFTFSNEFARSLANLSVTIYHSRDDDIIPVDDALRYNQKVPTARVQILDGYGHQFSGSLDFLAHDIRSATR